MELRAEEKIALGPFWVVYWSCRTMKCWVSGAFVVCCPRALQMDHEKGLWRELSPTGLNRLASPGRLCKPNPHLKASHYLPSIAVTQAKGNISPSCVYQTEFGEVTFTFNSFSNSVPWYVISTNTLDSRWSSYCILKINGPCYWFMKGNPSVPWGISQDVPNNPELKSVKHRKACSGKRPGHPWTSVNKICGWS